MRRGALKWLTPERQATKGGGGIMGQRSVKQRAAFFVRTDLTDSVD